MRCSVVVSVAIVVIASGMSMGAEPAAPPKPRGMFDPLIAIFQDIARKTTPVEFALSQELAAQRQATFIPRGVEGYMPTSQFPSSTQIRIVYSKKDAPQSLAAIPNQQPLGQDAYFFGGDNNLLACYVDDTIEATRASFYYELKVVNGNRQQGVLHVLEEYKLDVGCEPKWNLAFRGMHFKRL